MNQGLPGSRPLRLRMEDVTQQVLEKTPSVDVVAREVPPSFLRVHSEVELGAKPLRRPTYEGGVEKITDVDMRSDDGLYRQKI